MRGIVIGIALMVLIAIVAGFGIGALDQSAETAYTSPRDAVRLN